MEEIIDNIMQSPENTNPNVLRDQLQRMGTTITVDSTLSTESENPVQNKVISEALGNKADIFVVNFSLNLQTGYYECDKTYAQIISALSQNKYVIGREPNYSNYVATGGSALEEVTFSRVNAIYYPDDGVTEVYLNYIVIDN